MYCSVEAITDRLQYPFPEMFRTKYPDADEAALAAMWLNKVEAEIAHYSSYIDDSVGGKYPRQGRYRFPGWNDNPATPGVVGEICRMLVYASLIDYFNPVSTGTEDDDEKSLRDRAEQKLADIRKGVIVIEIESIGAEPGYIVKKRNNVFTERNFRGYGR